MTHDREEIKRDREVFRKNYIKNHVKDNTSPKFMRRLKHLYDKIEMLLLLDEYENFEKVVQCVTNMIQKEVKNAYCRSAFVYKILRFGNFSSLSDSYDRVVELFEKSSRKSSRMTILS